MPRLAHTAAGMCPALHVATGDVITPALDLGRTPTSAPVVGLIGEMDAEASVTIAASCSSSDGEAWTAWSAPGADGTLTSAPQRYWKIKLLFETSNAARTPRLTELFLLAHGMDADLETHWRWGYGGRWNE